MISDLPAVLSAAGLEPDLRELRDALWLARHITVAGRADQDSPAVGERGAAPRRAPPAKDRHARGHVPPGDDPAEAGLHAAGPRGGAGGYLRATEARSPAVPALRHQLPLARALKPFKRRVPARDSFHLDEAATAARVAEEGIWLPVLRPAPARWLDLALIVDTSASMVVWRRTVAEFQALAERLGAFRVIRVLAMDSSKDPATRLTLRPGSTTGGTPDGLDLDPATLIDPARRQATLVITDAVGSAWRDGRMDTVLRRWGAAAPTAVATLLPQRMWAGTGIRATAAQLQAPVPGAANSALRVRARNAGGTAPGPVPVPVMVLSARWLTQWAHLVAGAPEWRNTALLASPAAVATHAVRLPAGAPAAEKVRKFRAAASPAAFQLACYLSATWLNLPVMRLVQQVMLPESDTAHLAEVWLSGLLAADRADLEASDPETVQYDFLPGVRDELNDYLLRDELLDVLSETSRFANERFGQPLDFPALLADPEGTPLPALTGDGGQPFAYVAATVLARLGGRYGSLASRLADAETGVSQQESQPSTRADSPGGGFPDARDAEDDTAAGSRAEAAGSGDSGDTGLLARASAPGSVGAPAGQLRSGLRHDTARLTAGQRYLGIECPEITSVGSTFAVLVRIAMASGGTGGGAATLKPFSVPSGGVDVKLVLNAPGMLLLRDNRATVRVPADGDSEPVMFELRADAPGPYRISVTAWLAGAFLGEGAVDVTAERSPGLSSTRYSAARIAVEPEAGAVSLVVRYDPREQAYRFEFRDVDNPSEVVSMLTYEPRQHVERAMADIDDFTRKGYPEAAVRDSLIGIGAELWRELLPASVREQFWERQHRIRDLRILADKDIIPWELLYPLDSGHDAGFLVEQFPVTHAIFGQRSARRLGLRPARFVLPKDSSPEAAEEVTAVRELLGEAGPPTAVISELTPLLQLIRKGDFGLLHLMCEAGVDSDTGSLMLDNRQFSSRLMTTATIDRSLAASAPIVFLSTFRSPASRATYNRLDGWARAFLGAGAGAFVGSLWTVSPEATYQFATEFYSDLLAGSSLASAIMRARQSAATRPGDASWLAFRVYGDPQAVISETQ